jgi:glutamate synthase (NADPH/NADH) small chain
MAIEALGQGIAPALRESLKEIRLSREGWVRTEPQTGATSAAGVFAGGDIANGGATAVQGIAEGMRAATGIDAYLRGG